MKPDFIGIGVQKAATSWLFEVLSAHPEIYMGKGNEKDTRFFSCHFERGYYWYESHFEGRGAAMVAGEYSTSYFNDSDAPVRIHNYAPDIKLIVCLREPVDRAYSSHKHQVQLGYAVGELANFERGLENNPTYVDQSLYYKHLSKWYQLFDKEQILVLLMDDIRQAPQRVVERLYRFLGVNSTFTPSVLERHVNVSVKHRSQNVEKVITSVSRIMRRIGAGWLIDFVKKVGLRDRIRIANTIDQSIAFERPEEKTVNRLRLTFRKDIEQLESLIGLDLSAWK